MRRWVPIIALAVGCHSIEKHEEPPLAGMQLALVIALERDAIHVIATDSVDGKVTLPPVLPHGDTELWVLGFSCPLDRVGFAAGKLDLATMPAESSIVAPAGVHKTQLVAGESSAWAEVAMTPQIEDILARLEPSEGGCAAAAEFGTPSPVDVGEAEFGYLGFVAKPDPSRAWLGVPGIGIVEVGPQGDGRLLTSATTTASIATAFGGPDGTLYAVDFNGTLMSGDLAQGLTQLAPPVQRTTNFAKLVGPDRGDVPFELFLAADAAAFLRWDGSTWTRLAERVPGRREIGIGAAVWLDAGEAMSVGAGGERIVLHYVDGQTRRIEIPGDGRLTSIAKHPDYGVIVGSERGEIFVDSEGGFEFLGRVAGTPLALNAVGSGIWVGALTRYWPLAKSRGGFFHPSLPQCEPTEREVVLRDLVPMGDDKYLIVGHNTIFRGLFAERVTLRRPFASCSAVPSLP